MPVRIAVVQQHSALGAVAANRDKALAFARQALEGDADIVLFHEELLVGYVENLRDLAEPLQTAEHRDPPARRRARRNPLQ